MTRPHLLLVHGWGFDPEFWDPLLAELAGYPATCLDLGFFGQEDLQMPSQPFVAVGHSLGLLWLLRHMRPECQALVSLGGFGRFDVVKGPTRAMRRGLGRDTAAVLTAFYQACSLAPGLFPDISRARPDRLVQGLDWLLDWDETTTLTSFAKPVLALAAEGDVVVPPELSRASFPQGLIMLGTGGHAFPATRATECAGHIAPFLETL